MELVTMGSPLDLADPLLIVQLHKAVAAGQPASGGRLCVAAD